MALAYTNTVIELREISLKKRPSELYAISSKGTVPVLVTIDKLVIDESLEIMWWSLQNYSNQSWLSQDNSNELEMININDTLFKKWLDRYKYHTRYPEKSKEFYRDMCKKILNSYESQLAENKYLINSRINIVDIAIFPFVRQFAHVDYDWFKKNYNHLQNWLEKMTNSDLFNSVMKKYDTWETDSNTVIVKFNK
mgnify:CR=1 FL=1|tara:strand:- start:38 stop:622 length:585 start_codon:yes stop_codon:yes gene_type:complete